MTISKLKLAATITIGVAITGSLPFVTRAQNHPRRAGLKAAAVAAPSGGGLALSPVPPAVPKSLHIVYSITNGLAPRRLPLLADYWVTGPDAARWTSNGRYPMTVATDGRTWTELMEPPNTGSAIKVDARTTAMSPVPTQPSLRIERARSWNNRATGVYSPGVLAGEIPFLGFGQPGKIYRGKPNKVTKTAHGWEEHCRVPYGYGQSAADKPSLVDAVLTYDRQGRLVRFRRNRAGNIWENSVFSDFTMVGAMEIPRLVRYAETDEAGGRVVIDMAVTYQAQSLDEKPSPSGWFAMQHPPVGALVQDYRFADHKPTPGLGGENSSGVLYRYSGRVPLDEESRAKYRQSQDGPAR